MITYICGYTHRKGKDMSGNNLTSYQLKVDKKTWKKFKGTAYILGFDSVNDCLKHLIDECVNRSCNLDK